MGTREQIGFRAELTSLGGVALVRLPPDASGRLPSRGQVAVQGTIGARKAGAVDFHTVVEPDGRRGHWIRVGPAMAAVGGLEVGDVVEICLEVTDAWPEPVVPADLSARLENAPESIRELWSDITPMARWEWVRWVGATRSADTRHRRVEVTISKMEHGKRRPCCFDLASCTDPAVARSGKLPLA